MSQPLYFHGKCCTFYTSLLFIIPFIYSLYRLGQTHPVTLILMVLTITSLMQHSKEFKSKGDYGIVITVDQTIARIFPLIALYYFHTVLDPFLVFFFVFIIYIYVYNRCYLLHSNIYLASINHSIMHLFTIAVTIILIHKYHFKSSQYTIDLQTHPN